MGVTHPEPAPLSSLYNTTSPLMPFVTGNEHLSFLVWKAQSNLLSYQFQLFCCKHCVQVSFPVNIIRFNQLIINENKSDGVIRYDSYNT